MEIDGTYLQLYAVETSLQFLFQSSQHFLVSAHPYQAIDGDALLASAEWRVVEVSQVLCPSRNCETLLSIFRKSCRRCSRIPLCRSKETGKSRFQAKGDTRVSTNHIIRNAPHLFYHLANLSERHLVFRLGIATQVGQCGTLSHSLYTRNL